MIEMSIAKELLDASLQYDTVQLVKAYALLGFKEAHYGSEKGFEELWCGAFQSGESQAMPLERKTLALVPPHESPE